MNSSYLRKILKAFVDAPYQRHIHIHTRIGIYIHTHIRSMCLIVNTTRISAGASRRCCSLPPQLLLLVCSSHLQVVSHVVAATVELWRAIKTDALGVVDGGPWHK